MEYFWIVARQVLVMFLLMVVGMAVYKGGLLDDEGARQLSSFLLKITTPAVIIVAFQRPFDAPLLTSLGMAFLLGGLIYLMTILMVTILYRKSAPDYRDARMCLVFSNNGFMALPLLEALLGPSGVFLGSAHIVLGSMLVWTYGQFTLTHNPKSIAPRMIITNPGTIGVLIGLLLFVSPVKLPGPLSDAVSAVASLNTPLAMIVCGIFICQSNLLSGLRDRVPYQISFWKLIAIPLASMLLLWIFPVSNELRMTLMIATACPTATVCVMFAKMYASNIPYCVKNFALTTLLSMLTLPLVLAICQWIY